MCGHQYDPHCTAKKLGCTFFNGLPVQSSALSYCSSPVCLCDVGSSQVRTSNVVSRICSFGHHRQSPRDGHSKSVHRKTARRSWTLNMTRLPTTTTVAKMAHTTPSAPGRAKESVLSNYRGWVLVFEPIASACCSAFGEKTRRRSRPYQGDC